MCTTKSIGFSLLEVLIAVFVFSIGLLALLKTEIVVIRRQNSAFLHSAAISKITNLAELLIYPNWSLQRQQWRQQWQQQLKLSLPMVESHLSGSTIVLQWQLADTKAVHRTTVKQAITLG